MIAGATAKYVRISPRKVRKVIEHIKGKSVKEAYAILQHTNKRAASILYKVVKSAYSNLKDKAGNFSEDECFIIEAYANEGPTLMRYKPMAMGRAGRIRKRSSHITIKVANLEGR